MRIGVDVGGSHIGVGLVDENGTVIMKNAKYTKYILKILVLEYLI